MELNGNYITTAGSKVTGISLEGQLPFGVFIGADAQTAIRALMADKWEVTDQMVDDTNPGWVTFQKKVAVV